MCGLSFVFGWMDEWFERSSSDEYYCVQCPVCSPPSQDSFEFLELTKELFNISWPTSVRSVGNSMSSWFCYKPKTRFYWACDDVHVDSSQDFWNMKTTVLLLQVIFLASLCHGQRKLFKLSPFSGNLRARGPSRYIQNG